MSDDPGAAKEPVSTTCPYCGVGCGVLARPAADRLSAEVTGDPTHPANFGRLCSKGSALGETLSLEDRLLFPMVDGSRASWDAALDRVALGFTQAIAEHGPESVALYVSGQITTEDYYVANKLMKGYIGSANIDTNSRLCMASSVAGHRRAFGADTVPGTYEDLELADLVVLVGSNLAWCHPVLFQRLSSAREARGTKVIVVDPRRTATCEIADLHLALNPGSDVALFNALLSNLAATGTLDHAYIARHTSGFEAALAAASVMAMAEVVAVTGLAEIDIARFIALFANSERVVTVYSQGVNQSSSGTDKVNAIINCHLATGRIGKPGCGPFSVTGQPNAMGGREVGGLANMLAAHMDLADPEHRRIVQTFWSSPKMADRQGLKAVDLFQAVGDGRIKALWIMATNPVDSLPEADRVRAAIRSCPLVVVSDVTRYTDTTELGHVLLPAAAWGEKDGTVTNSERRISRQRPFLPLPGEARPDWWQITEVARRMGFGDAFNYTSPADIFAEYAALTGAENAGRRDLDISAHAGMTRAAYDALAPFQWPQPSGTRPADRRFFADGGYFTPDRRARLVAVAYRAAASPTDAAYPLSLNTGRIRDQWHTMTRTAKTARLMSHIGEPFVEIHPDDAAWAGVTAAGLAEVESRHGRAVLRVVITDRQPRGSVFAPMHWTGQYASAGRIDALVEANCDPVSGQPESKLTPVRVGPYRAAWFAFAVSEARPDVRAFGHWAVAPVAGGGFRAELADGVAPECWETLARRLFGTDGDLNASGAAELTRLAYHDGRGGQHRFAVFDGDRCVALLFVARVPVAVSRTWAAGQLGRELSATDRLRLLAGRPGPDMPDRGPIVCACLDVGRNEIAAAISLKGCDTVAKVGAMVKAGTNCGSCRSEIARLIDETRVATAV